MCSSDPEEGFKYKVRVTNLDDKTFFHGKVWKEFIRMYQLGFAAELVLSDLDEQGDSIPVTSTHQPMYHPCMLLIMQIFQLYYTSPRYKL